MEVVLASEGSRLIAYPPSGKAGLLFRASVLLPEAAAPRHIFEATAAPLVAAVADGYNACVLAVGPAGAGKTHTLFSAMVVAHQGVPVWRHVEGVNLTMRVLSDAFIADYLEAEGDVLLGCVGGYRIEGRGVQLFSDIAGSHFAIIGLPLLPLLAFLRTQGVVAT